MAGSAVTSAKPSTQTKLVGNGAPVSSRRTTEAPMTPMAPYSSADTPRKLPRPVGMCLA